MNIKTVIFMPALLVLALMSALPFAASAQGGRGGGHVTWSGTVDDTTIITIHRGDVNTQVVKGKSNGDVNAQVAGQLPARPARVFLAQQQGRGRIRVIQQPNPGNDFTARIRVRDPQPGSSYYRFVIAWQRGPRMGGPGAF